MKIKKEKMKNEDVEMTDSVPLPPTSETGFSNINNNNSDLLNINKSSNSNSNSNSNYSSTNIKQEDTDDSDDSDKGVMVEAKHTAGMVRNHPSIQAPQKPILPIGSSKSINSSNSSHNSSHIHIHNNIANRNNPHLKDSQQEHLQNSKLIHQEYNKISNT
ncbi:unnamed protein product [[Candida] boidinii]|uniref:Unnamed protein product n=1 Tax=Candida boidinii TaxID=5477 RepID=A0ACB5UBS3_CANBO|nr:unnamed protein product [[Candida] boidinii]